MQHLGTGLAASVPVCRPTGVGGTTRGSTSLQDLVSNSVEMEVHEESGRHLKNKKLVFLLQYTASNFSL